jgi:hypothetical protein
VSADMDKAKKEGWSELLIVATLREELREANEEIERCWADETELVQTINTLRLENAILRGKIASMSKEQDQ